MLEWLERNCYNQTNAFLFLFFFYFSFSTYFNFISIVCFCLVLCYFCCFSPCANCLESVLHVCAFLFVHNPLFFCLSLYLLQCVPALLCVPHCIPCHCYPHCMCHSCPHPHCMRHLAYYFLGTEESARSSEPNNVPTRQVTSPIRQDTSPARQPSKSN